MNYNGESPLKILAIRPMAKEDVWDIFRLLQKSWIRTITFITFCEKKKKPLCENDCNMFHSEIKPNN